MVTYRNRFPATHRSLSDARADIGQWLGAVEQPVTVPEQAVFDLDVVITELAANVIDHTPSPWIEVSIGLRDDHAVIEVSNAGGPAGLPPLERWGTLAEDERGRGLRLVRLLCSTIEIDGTDDRTAIACAVPMGDQPSLD